jgi:hypothetical protein
MSANDPRPDVAAPKRARLLRRLIAGVAAAGVILVILGSAGFPPASWFHADEHAAAQTSTARIDQSTEFSAPVPTAPATGARLHLVSTTPGRNVHEGTAQLGASLSNPETYAAGAWLENGATLREIHADHVVLERDGQSTKLYVAGVAAGRNAKQAPKVNEALVSLDTLPKAATPPRPPPPPTYTEILRTAPRFENDLIVGFDLYPGTDRGQFSRWGLQPGDLLASIDGVPMDSTEALHAALQSMRNGQAVSAVVLRKGQSVSVALELASPAQQQVLAGAAQPSP